MTKNPILDELRSTRERLLAESGGTLDGLVSRLQDEQRASGRRIISPTRSRTIRCTKAVNSGALPVENPSSPPGEPGR